MGGWYCVLDLENPLYEEFLVSHTSSDALGSIEEDPILEALRARKVKYVFFQLIDAKASRISRFEEVFEKQSNLIDREFVEVGTYYNMFVLKKWIGPNDDTISEREER